MEFIKWANGQGVTIRIYCEDAVKLIALLQERVKQIEIDGILYEIEVTN